mgnify:CR=1 FL=1
MFGKLARFLKIKKSKQESKQEDFDGVLAEPKKALTIEDFDREKARKARKILSSNF